MTLFGSALGPAILVLAASLAPPATTTAPAVAHDPGIRIVPAIDDLYRRFSQAYRSLDAPAVASLYTRDALYLQPDRSIQQGRGPIEVVFARFFARTRSVGLDLQITFHVVARQVTEMMAYDVGTYTLVSRRRGEEVGRTSGKFVFVTRPDDDGVWRLQVDANSDLGSEPAPH